MYKLTKSSLLLLLMLLLVNATCSHKQSTASHIFPQVYAGKVSLSDSVVSLAKLKTQKELIVLNSRAGGFPQKKVIKILSYQASIISHSGVINLNIEGNSFIKVAELLSDAKLPVFLLISDIRCHWSEGILLLPHIGVTLK